MTTATLNYSRAHNKIQSKLSSINLPDVNWKIICLLGFVACSILLFFYIYQVNSLTRGSYLINNYQNNLDKLSQENKNLEVSFAESSFLGEVLVKAQALDFQKTASVKYIQVLDNSFARANQGAIR